ncbi:INO80 complex subunit C [Octopus sinensis]|uniref:INO80 complex subunit C n=1 Tax=Octopus sinensis TaxID=2607531 RepID=A0A6P7SUZ2_9MOLL|nr:INO80 complex subunit C [Octopus sinensis]
MATVGKSPSKRKSTKLKSSTSSSLGAPPASKKKKSNPIPPLPPVENEELEDPNMTTTEYVERIPIFKDPNFVHSTKGAAGAKKRGWKNLKQIVASERAVQWPVSAVTYSSIEGPPSFKPAKKYSDISGLHSDYRDPQSKLRYHNVKEFSQLRMLPSDLVTAYLALRKANAPVP